jgi:hypothetical protein
MTVLIVVVAIGFWLAVIVFMLALCHAAAAGDRLVEKACSDAAERALESNRAAVARVAPEQWDTPSPASQYSSSPASGPGAALTAPGGLDAQAETPRHSNLRGRGRFSTQQGSAPMFELSPRPPRLVGRPIDTATERISVFQHATIDGCHLASGDGVVVAISGELLELSDQQAFSLGAELMVAGFGHTGDPALAIAASGVPGGLRSERRSDGGNSHSNGHRRYDPGADV